MKQQAGFRKRKKAGIVLTTFNGGDTFRSLQMVFEQRCHLNLQDKPGLINKGTQKLTNQTIKPITNMQYKQNRISKENAKDD